MPFNSATPINAFPSTTLPRPVSHWNKRQPLADINSQVNNQSKSVRSTRFKMDSTKPPSDPDKSLATSPLLGPHDETVVLAPKPNTQVTDKRLSTFSLDSDEDLQQWTHSPREIKKTVGAWNLGRTLGTGATGRVRKARHVHTGQIAAVKIMSKKEAFTGRSYSVMNMDNMIAKAQPGVSDRLPFGLEREVVIMRLFDHPHITKLYDVWDNRGEIYLILEHVEGGELYQYIRSRGCIPEMDAIRLFRQLLSAVNYCHRFRICHRDIKPENVMIDKSMNVKLVDFGMASRDHLGGLDTSCGSPHYIAPELAYGGQYMGHQVDIWACGVVLYVMLLGSLPFGSTQDSDNVPEIMNEILNVEPDYRRLSNPEAVDLLERMLEKEPADRITGEQIWLHPLMEYWNAYAETCGDEALWACARPTPLTTDDCGRGIDRSALDLEEVTNLCMVWQNMDEEEMIRKLVSDKPNYEKILYEQLLKFRKHQEETYGGFSIEHADSDVHRIRPHAFRNKSRADLLGPISRLPTGPSSVSFKQLERTLTRQSLRTANSSRADLLGSTKRSAPEELDGLPLISAASKFTIVAPPPKRSVSKHSVTSQFSRVSRPASQNPHSDALTYDPFRPLSSSPPTTATNKAKKSGKDQPSTGSNYAYVNYAASLRRPAINNSNSACSSARNSVVSAARDHLGHTRSLRRCGTKRITSSSSWVSTRMASSSVRQFPVPSVRSKRVMQIPVVKKRSQPPSQPRNPTPTRMQHHCKLENQRHVRSSLTSDPLGAIQKESQPAQLFQNLGKGFSLSPPRTVDRTSTLWEERTRQVSLELSTLMDEVFSETNIDAALWDDKVREQKQEEFIRRSYDLPVLRSTGYASPLPEVTLKKAEAPPPCDDLPKLRSIYDADSLEELTRLKNLLETQSQCFGTDYFDPVIKHLNRLIHNDPCSRRILSAPQALQRSENGVLLSPVKEEEESRHVSSPLKNRSGRWEKSSFRGKVPTVRLVSDGDEQLVPAPLKVRKKASLPFFNSTRSEGAVEQGVQSQSPNRRLKFGPSSTAINKIFKRDAIKSNDMIAPSNIDLPEKVLPSTPPAHDARRYTSGDGRPRNWFRRSQGSDFSDDGSFVVVAARDKHVRSNTNTSDEEITFRLPEKESTKVRLLRFFSRQPKKQCMRIATPDQASATDDWEDSPTDSEFGDFRRSSRFAHTSSPHLFSTTKAHEPYAESGGPGSLFARIFNVPFRQAAPPPHLVCLSLPRDKAVHEIRRILRDWRRYGLVNVRVNSRAGTVHATVSEDNHLSMQPVTFVATVHAVAVDKNAHGLSIVKITSEWGNRNSFVKTCEALTGVLRGRHLLIQEKRIVSEMKGALRDWERL